MAEIKVPLSRFSTWRICSHEQAKRECDWLVMTSVFVTSQSSCFFLCSREQIRQVENRLYSAYDTKIFVLFKRTFKNIEYSFPFLKKHKVTSFAAKNI